MPAPDPSVTRVLECGEADRLSACSHLAMRVWLRLFYGPDSERAGVVPCRPAVLADDLGSSRRAVVSALAELVSTGLIAHDADALVAARPGFEVRHLPAMRDNRVSWLRGIAGLRDCLIVAEARANIQSAIERSSEHRSEHRSEHSIERSSDPPRALAESGSPGVLSSLRSDTSPLAPSLPGLAGEGKGKPRKPGKPTGSGKDVIDAYNELRQSLAACAGKDGSAARKKADAAWRREPDIEVWRSRFRKAATSDFLTGKTGTFKADLLWLLGAENAEKVDAGRYDNRTAASGPNGRPMRPEDAPDFDYPDSWYENGRRASAPVGTRLQGTAIGAALDAAVVGMKMEEPDEY